MTTTPTETPTAGVDPNIDPATGYPWTAEQIAAGTNVASAVPAESLPADGASVATSVGQGNAPVAERKQHAKPIFELQHAGALPSVPKSERTAPAGVTREMRFKDHLVQIQADPVTAAGDEGHWYMLADYGAATTAKRTAKILTEAVNPAFTTHGKDGEVLTHGGEMLDLVNDTYTYEFAGQRHETDPKRSKLFARYVARAALAQPATVTGDTPPVA